MNFLKNLFNVFMIVVGCVLIWKSSDNLDIALGILSVACGLYGKLNDVEDKIEEIKK